MDWKGRQTFYTYDASGGVKLVMLSNVVASSYEYDRFGRLNNLEHNRGVPMLAGFAYTYDPSSNRLQAVENVRQLVTTIDTTTPPSWSP